MRSETEENENNERKGDKEKERERERNFLWAADSEMREEMKNRHEMRHEE